MGAPLGQHHRLPLGIRVMAVSAKILIGGGLLVLGFVVYTLWGTSLSAGAAQSDLQASFAAQLATTTTAPAVPPPGPTTTVAPPVPVEGEPLARIEIPRIGVDWIVVSGVSTDDLKKGPGHYPETPLPGHVGNVAIAGHRTTYGAPFSGVEELVPGDEVRVTTVQGTFTYVVEGTDIVLPTQVEVLAQTPGEGRLTLTSCHPRYSAAQRIVVSAALAPGQIPLGLPDPGAPATTTTTTAPPATGPTSNQALGEGDPLGGDPTARVPAALWGLAAALVATAAWWAGRQWKRWPAYLVATPFFLVALFRFYENVGRLFPSNI